MVKILDDLLILAGMAVIVYGFYVVWPVLAIFASGIFLVVLGILIGAGSRSNK